MKKVKVSERLKRKKKEEGGEEYHMSLKFKVAKMLGVLGVLGMLLYNTL